MAYATVDDLTEYVDPPPANAPLLLDRASRLVTRATLTAIYDSTDATIQAALRTATCEQVAAWVAGEEDGTGATPVYTNVSIGSVTLGGRTSTAGAAGGARADELAPQARLTLDEAGLLNGPIRTC